MIAEVEDVLASRPLWVSPYQPEQMRMSAIADFAEMMCHEAAQVRSRLAALERSLEELAAILNDIEWIADPSAYEVWKRPDTADTYAIRLLGDKVTGCVGPMRWEVTPDLLPGLRYDLDGNERLIPWVERHRHEFRVIESNESIDEVELMAAA